MQQPLPPQAANMQQIPHMAMRNQQMASMTPQHPAVKMHRMAAPSQPMPNVAHQQGPPQVAKMHPMHIMARPVPPQRIPQHMPQQIPPRQAIPSVAHMRQMPHAPPATPNEQMPNVAPHQARQFSHQAHPAYEMVDPFDKLRHLWQFYMGLLRDEESGKNMRKNPYQGSSFCLILVCRLAIVKICPSRVHILFKSFNTRNIYEHVSIVLACFSNGLAVLSAASTLDSTPKAPNGEEAGQFPTA